MLKSGYYNDYQARMILEDAIRKTPATRVTILATGFSQLPELGKEEPGYGLYSYAVLSFNSDRASAFLGEIFKSVHTIQDTPGNRAQLNIFYLPIKKEAAGDFENATKSLEGKPDELGAKFTASFYDYRTARAILNHVCNPPADAIRELCQGDMSRGPYIFTYAKPASSLEPVPPPFLFVDLSDVDPRAYGEFVAAFKAQVKREDIADGAKIDSIRLRILKIALKASDLVVPVQKAVADIIYSTTTDETKKK